MASLETFVQIASIVGVLIAIATFRNALHKQRIQQEGMMKQQQDKIQKELLENERRHSQHEMNIALMKQSIDSLSDRMDERLSTTNELLGQLLAETRNSKSIRGNPWGNPKQ